VNESRRFCPLRYRYGTVAIVESDPRGLVPTNDSVETNYRAPGQSAMSTSAVPSPAPTDMRARSCLPISKSCTSADGRVWTVGADADLSHRADDIVSHPNRTPDRVDP
jgi:hypothetical protein